MPKKAIFALIFVPNALVGCALFSLSTSAFAQTQSPFLDQVKANFQAWDLDKNNTLEASEIELAVANPQVKGNAAAAAAALRRAIRYYSIPSLTLDEISAAIPYKKDAEPKRPGYEGMYDSALKKIGEAKRELFVDDEPKLDSLGQGRLGDCFLLATLGVLTYQQPERLKAMFEPTADGKVTVKLAKETFTIPAVTDAELVIGASTRNRGMYANMFEKSIGDVYLRNSKSGKYFTPLNIVGVGGSPARPLALVTGKRIVRVGCEDFQKPGKLVGAEREARLQDIRVKLLDQKANNRLTVGGTGPLKGIATVVPGLYYNHSYGVLDYDKEKDAVLFWNPMGNGYKPKGEPSLKNGYPTSHGQFWVPLAEAVMWFGSFSMETDEPAPVTAPDA